MNNSCFRHLLHSGVKQVIVFIWTRANITALRPIRSWQNIEMSEQLCTSACSTLNIAISSHLFGDMTEQTSRVDT